MGTGLVEPQGFAVSAKRHAVCLTALTLPVGLDRGMPVGLQFIAKDGDDERLVANACAAERVLSTPRLGAPPMCRASVGVCSIRSVATPIR